MHLGWLELSGFRNYERLTFRPDPGINLLVGPNGAGKTNILEAIDYLGRLRSFRAAPDGALVGIDADSAVLRGEVEHHAAARLIEIQLPRHGKRRVQVNGKRPSRFAEMRTHLRSVAFLPDDLDLVKGGPARRRELLDDLAVQLRPAAGGDLQDFDRALRQRNALLRREGPLADRTSLDSWDDRLADAGGRVYANRRNSVEVLSPRLSAAYGSVSGMDEQSRCVYEPSWTSGATTRLEAGEALRRALQDARRADLDRRTTTVGPHRDDPRLLIGGRDARTHASQGEQRSLVLAVRLAVYDLVREEFGEAPLLLLDDVFSELDASRAAAVLQRLPAGQVFISSARPEDVPVDGRRWDVGRGVVG